MNFSFASRRRARGPQDWPGGNKSFRARSDILGVDFLRPLFDGLVQLVLVLFVHLVVMNCIDFVHESGSFDAGLSS